MQLNEGRKEFLAWADGNKELLDRFLVFRGKVSGNEANMDWWVANKTPQELEDFMKNFKSKTQKEKEIRSDGTKFVYEDDNWKVLHILTYQAAVQYGKGSKWCICGNYPGYEKRGQYYFDKYLKDNYSGYYIFLNKHPQDPEKDAKYMVCIHKDNPSKADIWNQPDSMIDYIPNGPSIKGFPSVSQFKIIDGVLVDCKRGYGEYSVTLPDGIEAIKYRLFARSGFNKIILPSSLKKIGSACFMQSSLNELDIPDSVEEIGKGLFCNCDGLMQVTLGTGITYIPDLTFAYSDDVKVEIRGKISSISDSAFKSAKRCMIYCHEEGNEEVIRYAKEHGFNAVDIDTNEVLSDRQQG